MTIENPKFCNSCVFFNFGSQCDHPSLGRDLVTGNFKTESAAFMRTKSGKCGPEAKLFKVDKWAIKKDEAASIQNRPWWKLLWG